MATGYEGIAARLNFTQSGRAARKAWPKLKLEAGPSVAEVLEALKERPGFTVDSTVHGELSPTCKEAVSA